MAEEKKKNPPAGGQKIESIVDEVSKLSVLELSELVEALKEKLGVEAMPVAAPSTSSGQAPAEESKGEAAGGSATQTVVMTTAGNNRIAVIKALREINQNLGLKEAKDMTEQLPAEILKDAKAEDAKSAVEKLKTAGATVEVK